jgi:hypothetical protein
MHFAMMDPAERDRELIARFAAKRFLLSKAQMVSVGRLPTADQAGLSANKPKMLTISQATRLGIDHG